MTIAGVDVSHHQASTPRLDGYDFLIARAAYGTSPDASFVDHVRAARRRGLVVGAYLFLRHGRVREQVAVLLGQVAKVDGVDLVAIDWESDGRNPPATADEAREAIEVVQSTGRPVGLYTSTSRFPRDAFGADWRWVADYRPLDEPPIPWDVWQWTSTAGGLNLDRNRYRGTRAELVALGRPATEDPMHTFTVDPTKLSVGRITVVGTGHSYMRLRDGARSGPIDPTSPAWIDRPAFGPVTLTPDIDGKATTGPRAIAYIVGVEAAALLATDVTFTETASDRAAVLDEAIDAIAKLKGG